MRRHHRGRNTATPPNSFGSPSCLYAAKTVEGRQIRSMSPTEKIAGATARAVKLTRSTYASVA